MNIPSYGKIVSLGHRYSDKIIDGREVRIEEKTDGSQLSVMKSDGLMLYRTRKTELFPETDDKLFKKAVTWFEDMKDLLPEGVIFRCEAIMGPRHNHLTYEYPPESGFVLWDLEDPVTGDVWSAPERLRSCYNWGLLGLEPLFIGSPGVGSQAVEFFRSWLGKPSFLGGKMEGIVIKPLEFTHVPDTMKRLAVKLVNEEYREEQSKSFRSDNPTKSDIIMQIGERYAVEARYRKAVQHLRESGVLEESVRDIGPLMKELNRDLEEECVDEIKDMLWKWGKKNILGKSSRGFPQWYKDYLIENLTS
jgi:hypothetical protein